MTQFFSLAQCFGYLAFILGVSAFAQKKDSRLKFLNASECLAYTIHFFLLGNPAASVSALISSIRSFLSLKTRSPFLAAAVIAVNIGVALAVVKSGAGWLPVLASCSATIAVFLLDGIPMRLLMMLATLLWLANNILSRSIGGTLLETVIATVNLVTMFRLLRSCSAAPRAQNASEAL